MSFSVACKSCGNVVTVPTPETKIAVLCQRCGAQDWRVPATAEEVAKSELRQQREARAIELCRSLDLDGLLKVPDDVPFGSAELKNALSNLFAPLEGETLKLAQSLVLKVARSPVAVTHEAWVEMYDRAVAKAIKDTAKGAEAAKGK